MASTAEHVRIHYRRPPDREEIFEQAVLARTADCVVTFLPRAGVNKSVEVGGHTILEPGAPIVWFTFPGRWHDIGRFHTADGVFRGFYANVLTPVAGIESRTWYTTDLFLDVWLDTRGEVRILDMAELEEAVAAGAVDAALARRAQAEAAAIVASAGAGAWPPPIVAAWPLERAVALACAG